MVLISVLSTKGSVPREAGTWMVVDGERLIGTIGGGRLEFDAIAFAQTTPSINIKKTFALGPSLGQCCGGTVTLSFGFIDLAGLTALQASTSKSFKPVALFGGGHVGLAIVQAFAPLPFNVSWIDSRDEIFPNALPHNCQTEHSAPVQAAVADIAAGSAVLIMSFSHAEDLDIVAACLKRNREANDLPEELPFIGLIGSKTKWVTFQNRLRERGFTTDELAQITCPIGLPTITGKEPAVIAAGVAAQLLSLKMSAL